MRCSVGELLIVLIVFMPPSITADSGSQDAINRNATDNSTSRLPTAVDLYKKKIECQIHVYLRRFTHPLCTPLVANVKGCRGHCQSLSVPSIIHLGRYTSSSHPTFHDRCRCCRPAAKKVGRLIMNCPWDPMHKKRQVSVAGAAKCECRLCSYEI
jgi:hypothetical protein